MKKIFAVIFLPMRLCLLGVLVGIFCFIQTGSAGEYASPHALGELLLKFKGDNQIYKIKISPDADLDQTVMRYRSVDQIEFLEPNYLYQQSAFPNDPGFNRQWYLTVINVKDQWSRELLAREQENIGRRGIIAVIDGGIFLNHPDLKNKIWSNADERPGDNIDNDKNGYADDVNGWDFVDDDSDPNPNLSGSYNIEAVNHGTIVAGIAAAGTNNYEGMAGAAWFADIMPLRVLDNSGLGDVYTVVLAINYAIDNGADVINLSLVGNGYSQILFEAIKRANDRGIIVVAAAGNTDPKINGTDLDITKSYPVCYQDDASQNLVIGVASVGKDLKKSDFSSFGSCVDIVAPGQDLYSSQYYAAGLTGFTNYYNGGWSGTSLSAPLVSGVMATIKALRPGLGAEDIKNYVLSSARNIYLYNASYLGKLGAGMLDAGEALKAVMEKAVVKEAKSGNGYIVVGLGYKSFPQIKIVRADGSIFKEFFAYALNFSGPVNVASGDMDGDGQDEVITAAGAGGGPHVKVFDVDGHLLSEFYAYEKNYYGGVNITAADIDRDGREEIIAAPNKNYKPEVRIFSSQGKLLGKFYAYGENFYGGVKLAAADFDHDGRAEIVTAAGAGGGPHIRVFSGAGALLSQFFAYNSLYRGGVNVACGDVHGDNQPDIITTIEKGAMPEVKIFSYFGTLLNSFYAFDPSYLQGMYLTAGDVNNDSRAEIITGGSSGTSSQIKIFDLNGKMQSDFLAHNKNYSGGARPAFIFY